MAPGLFVKIRITISGHTTLGTTKSSDPVREISIARPVTFRIFFTSRFPQYWAARMPEPLLTPKTRRVNTKNTLLVVSPSCPIIIVSTRFTMVFNIPCMATGKAIRTAFLKNVRSCSISLVSAITFIINGSVLSKRAKKKRPARRPFSKIYFSSKSLFKSSFCLSSPDSDGPLSFSARTD